MGNGQVQHRKEVHHERLEARPEQIRVQQLVAQSALEALRLPDVPRRPGCDPQHRHSRQLRQRTLRHNRRAAFATFRL
jgi:hypothetical protein